MHIFDKKHITKASMTDATVINIITVTSQNIIIFFLKRTLLSVLRLFRDSIRGLLEKSLTVFSRSYLDGGTRN